MKDENRPLSVPKAVLPALCPDPPRARKSNRRSSVATSKNNRRNKRSSSLTIEHFEDVQKPQLTRLQSYQMPRPRRGRRTVA
jgi:hypothetical protein